LDIIKLKTESYRKYIQLMYKEIKDINSVVLIVKYELEKGGREVIETNKSRVVVMVKVYFLTTLN